SGGGAERDARLENLLVGQLVELLHPCPAPLGGPGAGPPEPRPGQLGVTTEEVRDVFVGLLAGFLLRGPGVDGDAETDVALPRVTGVPPGRPVRLEMNPQLRDIQVAEPDEER